MAVELAPVRRLPKPVTLAQMKADPVLKDLEMVRQFRLSVSTVTDEQWARVLDLAGD